MLLGAVFSFLAMVTAPSAAAAGRAPKLLATYLAKDKAVTGEVGIVMPPKEIGKYIAKVQAAAKADPDPSGTRSMRKIPTPASRCRGMRSWG